MIELARSIEIAAPPAEVWGVLSDFGAIGRWAANVDHSCLMSGQAEGPGAVRRIQTGRNTIVERVAEWEPGSTLSYRIEGLPPVVKSV
ncbi:MAG: SRPBCC family protein, partial [Actinomycetia bacterium]|nr:SRPBCC family protein [Actinomycetes bacterium]